MMMEILDATTMEVFISEQCNRNNTEEEEEEEHQQQMAMEESATENARLTVEAQEAEEGAEEDRKGDALQAVPESGMAVAGEGGRSESGTGGGEEEEEGFEVSTPSSTESSIGISVHAIPLF